MVILYSLFVRLYVLGIRLASLWNAKAKAWVEGRKNWAAELSKTISPGDQLIWVHCASAGELEQAKPVVEALKIAYPSHRLLVTFFSPSGMAAGRKWGGADLLAYLPADTPANAQKFIELVHPELVLFVKYEYWYHHLKAASSTGLPILLVSAIFRRSQPFFKWYGGFFKKILRLYRQIFVQDEDSAALLRTITIDSVSVAGDTRFDRVLRILEQPAEVPYLREFAGNEPLIVAGSTWPEDETLLAACLQKKKAKLVLAPHEINPNHLASIRRLFPDALFYSQLSAPPASDARVLVIDSFGLLSKLYHYATVTYIGGGFNKSGIHNTLEAAVYSKPVIFGPHYQKFKEARDLVAAGAAISIQNEEGLQNALEQFLNDAKGNVTAGQAAGSYVKKGAGATRAILSYIQENRLLTN